MKLKNSFIISALIAGSLLWNGYALADEQSSNEFILDDVLVTATRTLEKSQKVPASVTVITAEEIKEKNITTVPDIFKNAVGIFVDRPKGVADTAGGVEMRGFGESDILVLYDGMPMNVAYNGGVNWTAIPVDNIERVEVVRGAGSSLYGGRAVAGIINIITKNPEETKIRINSIYGSDNTWRNSISLSQKASDKFSYYLSHEHRSTDGFPNKVVSSTSSGSSSSKGTVGQGVIIGQKVDGKPRYIIGTQGDGGGKSDTYNLKLKYNFDDCKNVSYSYTHDQFKYYTENPVSYIYDAKGNPLFNGSVKLPNGKWYNFIEADFADYYGRRNTDVHAIKYEDTANKVVLNVGLSDAKDSGYSTPNEFLAGDKPGSDTAYPSKSYKLDFQKTWDNIGKHTVVGGFSWQNDKMTRTTTNLEHWHDKNSITSITSQTGGKDQNLSLFLQDEYNLTEKWKIYGGLRLDHYKKYDGYYNEIAKSNINYKKTSYNELSPKIVFEYAQDDKTIYYTSYGHSFNPPSLYQLYRTDRNYIGNPYLEPETTNTLEAGIKKQLGEKSSFNLALYQSKTDNLITSDTVDVNGTSKKWYKNLENVKRMGLELDFKHQFDKQWAGYLNYARQKGEDSKGEKLYSIPENVFHAGVKYNKKKLTANLDAEYISERNEPGSISGVYLSYDGFFLANFGVNYKINRDAIITFNVNNIFDKDYYLWYAAPGRTCTLGVQFEF